MRRCTSYGFSFLFHLCVCVSVITCAPRTEPAPRVGRDTPPDVEHAERHSSLRSQTEGRFHGDGDNTLGAESIADSDLSIAHLLRRKDASAEIILRDHPSKDEAVSGDKSRRKAPKTMTMKRKRSKEDEDEFLKKPWHRWSLDRGEASPSVKRKEVGRKSPTGGGENELPLVASDARGSSSSQKIVRGGGASRSEPHRPQNSGWHMTPEKRNSSVSMEEDRILDDLVPLLVKDIVNEQRQEESGVTLAPCCPINAEGDHHGVADTSKIESWGMAAMPESNLVESEAMGAEDGEPEVDMGSDCDFMDEGGSTCWYDREVGDSVTLTINVRSEMKTDTFAVRWQKVFHVKGKKIGFKMEIRPERAAWNAVVGSGGLELRLSPLTDSDMDFNSFTAKVFGIRLQNGRKSFKLIRELSFHLNIMPVDMGFVYTGEEVNVNIENYISLPAEGVTFDWMMEMSRTELQPMPSNMKISPSGRSMTIKELKKNQAGIISCAVYSSENVFVGKRRFKIEKPEKEFHRRSLVVRSASRYSGNLPNESKKIQKISRSLNSKKRMSAKKGIGKELPCYKMQSTSKKSHPPKEDRNSRYSHLLRYDNSPKHRPNKRRFLRKEIVPRSETKTRGRTHRHPIPLERNEKRRTPKISRQSPEEDAEEPRPIRHEEPREVDTAYDQSMEDVIPKEIHYVTANIILVTHEPQEHSMSFDDQESYLLSDCLTDEQCSPLATCTISEKGHRFCKCHGSYHGNGIFCYEEEDSSESDSGIEKRSERGRIPGRRLRNDDDMSIEHSLFYEDDVPRLVTSDSFEDQKEYRVRTQTSPEFDTSRLMFDEQEAYILSRCKTNSECSSHATCFLPTNGHGYCKCVSGYHGNGVFCWEDMNHIPQDVVERMKMPASKEDANAF